MSASASTPLGFALWLCVLGLASAIYHPVGTAMLVAHAENRGREIGIIGLVSQLLGPEGGQEEVGTAVVVLAHLAGRGLAFVEKLLGGLVQRGGQDAGALVAVRVLLVAEGLSQGQELAEGIPAQVVFFFYLLDVLRGGAAGTGLEEAATCHEWNHR